MASVHLRAVYKRIREATIVDNLDLAIADGEFLVIVGPSGCGKSTTLNMIAGLEDVSAGAVWIGDRDVTRLSPRERNIAMVFQSYALYPNMTVAQNIGFALRMARRPRAEIKQRVGKTAAMLGIEPLLDRKPRALSGGQRQRVALGRALARDADVFLFDEPLSNLDAKLRGEMRSEIKRLHARLGATVIYVTHDQVEAMTMATRIVVMNAGQVEQVGAPLEIYNRPATRFVAEFMGAPTINLLPGVVDLARGHPNFHADDEAMAVPLPPYRSVGHGDHVQLGVRPEHVLLTRPGNSDRAESWPAIVQLVEPLGREAIVEVCVGQNTLKVLTDASRLTPGMDVGIRFDSDHLHLFDALTGKALT